MTNETHTSYAGRGKFRDLREWGTFALSLFAAVCIPIGVLILRNQKLEIEKGVAALYVPRISYSEDLMRAETQRIEQRSSIATVQSKLDNIALEQVRMSDNIALLKERIQERKP